MNSVKKNFVDQKIRLEKDLSHVNRILGNKMEDEWDFVQEYYPNYTSSDEILENEYLFQLHTQDFEPGSGAEEYLNKEYGGDINSPQIIIDYDISSKYVFQKAIQGYIESLKYERP